MLVALARCHASTACKIMLQVVNGAALNGTGLAKLIEQMVTALNARDIPTAGSILEHFNKELMYKVRLGTQMQPAQHGAPMRLRNDYDA